MTNIKELGSFTYAAESIAAASAAPASYSAQPVYYNQPPVQQLYPGAYYMPGYTGAAAAAGAGVKSDPIAEPTFAKASGSFGVLSHVDSITDTFLNAKRGILDLRDGLLVRPSDKEKALIERVTAYITEYVEGEGSELADYFGPFVGEDGHFKLDDLDGIVDPGHETTVSFDEYDEATRLYKPVTKRFTQNNYSALFGTGKVLVKDIRTVDALRYGLSVIRKRRQREIERLQEQLADVTAEIPNERDRLAALERQRLEGLGDYAVARRLVSENWTAVEQAYADRRRVLEGNLGLYYVRVRETPLTSTLPDPLDLRYGAADDIVPGCPLADVDLPDELAPFMETVLDIPVGDWTALRDLYHLLPGRTRLDTLVKRRRERLTLRRNQEATATAGSTLAARLAPLSRQTDSLTTELLARPFAATGSLLQVQRQGRDLLSLEDLLSGPPHRLRGRAATLHGRLDAGAGCLIERLRAVTPSLRLDWASAAEADRLDVEHAERWSGLERAEAADFNGVRTLLELVDWWFRQLHADAAASSRTAMRNFVRACLLFAAQDDPQQILRGSLKTAPPIFRAGTNLRLALNREALPGTTLQLLDAQARVVGTLRVDDHDEQGAIASVMQVLDTTARPDTSFTVSGVVSTLTL
jgi:hypothetical protein